MKPVAKVDMKPVVELVDLAKVMINGDTQMRKSISPEWIQGMIENMKEGAEYPPIDVRFDGTNYWLSNGFHRYHAQSRLGLKQVQASILPGTREDARRDAFKANGAHGLPLSREDKIFKVNKAIADPLYKDLSDRAMAELCDVSRSLVGSVRRPEVKEMQKENMRRHIEKKAKQIEEECRLTTPETKEKPQEVPIGGEGPDEAELLANEAQHAADLETLAKFLDADDKMAHLYEEVQRLTSLNVGFELRIKELMNEKRSAVKLAEKLQKELDKIKGKK